MNETKNPSKQTNKKKKGFAVPVGEWFKDERYRNNFHGDGIVNDLVVKKTYDDHVKGEKDYSEKLWSLYMYNLLKEKGILEVI